MTDIVQPVPITLLPVPPQPTDTPEEFDAKSFATLDAQVVMVPQVNAAADATWKNAKAGEERAIDAHQAKVDAETARDLAQTAATNAGASAAVVSRWDKLVLGTKDYFPTTDNDGDPLLVGAEFYNSVTKARYSWTGTAWAIGTNVTAGVSSVNGRAGPVTLSMADVAPGSVVAYGPDKASARAAIDAGFDFTRGQQTWTTSQTINKSIFGTAAYVEVEMWGGGASGGAAVSTTAGNPDRAGGEGGEYVRFVARISDLPTSISLVVGAGGAAVTATASGTAVTVNGNPGGATSFNGIAAPGGIVDVTAQGQYGGSKQWLQGKNGGDGGGVGASNSITARLITGPGGSSIHGGGGGGGSINSITQPGGTSTFGGAGGLGVLASSTGATAGAGVAPGGGGGGIRYNSNTGTATSGAGGRGEIRARWF